MDKQGLRKKVREFQKKNYTENFVQACFDALGNSVKGGIIVVGGDGRYYLDNVLRIIIGIGAAAGVKKFVVGIDGILSTPSASYIIRKFSATGGFVLTASHNPGGVENDFGIKYNEPALEAFTERVYEISRTISRYKTVPLPDDIRFDQIGKRSIANDCEIAIVDSVSFYSDLMKELFDFECLAAQVQDPQFKIRIDCMHGVTGPYARRIFVKELGATEDSVINYIPKPDFGGSHPDPNLTYAKQLVKDMATGVYDFGAAFDGDGDRNMVLGRDIFVTPSDSLAIIAANHACIPHLQGGLKGVARSMPTSAALDQVAKRFGIKHFETPTGWKYFGNLMDAGYISLCGEESFGQGSDHIREKDGIWAALAWLSIIASQRASVLAIVENHWRLFGRNFYTRYDYEGVSSFGAHSLMERLRKMTETMELMGKDMGKGYTIKWMDDFCYTDPVSKSVASKQGIRILFDNGSRIVVRLSGTGSSDATVRIYIEKYESEAILGEVAVCCYRQCKEENNNAMKDTLHDLVSIALEITQLKTCLERDKPTVIT